MDVVELRVNAATNLFEAESLMELAYRTVVTEGGGVIPLLSNIFIEKYLCLTLEPAIV